MVKFLPSIVLMIVQLCLVSGDEEITRKCSTLPRVQHRLNAVIVDCQNQVKEDMIRDALQQIRFSENQQYHHPIMMNNEQAEPVMMINPALATNREDIHWMVKRFKRDLGLYDHPTIMSNDDKEIAGVRIKELIWRLCITYNFAFPVSVEVLLQEGERPRLLRVSHSGWDREPVHGEGLGS